MVTSYTNALLLDKVRKTLHFTKDSYPQPWVYLVKAVQLEPGTSPYMPGSMMKLKTLVKLGISEQTLQDSVIAAPTTEELRSWIYDNLGVLVYMTPIHEHGGISFGYGTMFRQEDHGIDYSDLYPTWRQALEVGMRRVLEDIVKEEK